MAFSRKNMWDTLDKIEGRKDSSYGHLEKERKRQGYDKKHEVAKKMNFHEARKALREESASPLRMSAGEHNRKALKIEKDYGRDYHTGRKLK